MKSIENRVLIAKIIDGVGVDMSQGFSMIDSSTLNITDCQNIIDKLGYNPMVCAEQVYIAIFNNCMKLLGEKPQLASFKATSSEQSNEIDLYLSQVPHRYEIFMPLPESKANNFDINRSLTVRTADEKLMRNMHKAGAIKRPILSGLISVGDEPTIKAGDNLLVISDSGYVDAMSEKFTRYDPVFILKMYVALHMVFKTLKYGGSPKYKAGAAYQYEIFDGMGAYKRSMRESGEDSMLIDSLVFVDDQARLDKVNEIMGTLLSRHKVEGIEKVQTSIKNSLYWYFESQKNTYKQIKIVNTVTAFDAFFAQGDSDINKSQLIAEVVTNSVTSYNQAVNYLQKLQNHRNAVIHGSKQIARASDYQDENDYEFISIINNFYLGRFITEKITRFSNSILKV
jgi:hypothetical protein